MPSGVFLVAVVIKVQRLVPRHHFSMIRCLGSFGGRERFKIIISMHGTYRTNHNRSYTTYRCNNQATRLDCDLHEMNAPALESFVIDSLCKHFFDPENIDVITEEINRKLREDINSGREEIKAVKYSIAGLRTARNNLVDAIAEHGYSKTLSDRLKNLEDQIEKYEKMISDDESKTLDVRVTRDEVIERIEKMRECLKNPDNFEQTKILLRKYVDRIEVSNTRIKVIFKTTFSCYIDDEEYTASYGFEAESTWREVLNRQYTPNDRHNGSF